MKSTFWFLFCLAFSFSTYGQNTFSQLYNTEDNNDYRVHDALLMESSIISVVSTVCNQNQCCEISKMDFDGNLLRSIIVENFSPTTISTIAITKNDSLLICSGKNDSIVEILKIDSELTGHRLFSLNNSKSVVTRNRGILYGGNFYYVFGQAIQENDSNIYAHILKINAATNQIEDTWFFDQGNFRNSCYDLKFLPDSSLVFRNEMEDAGVCIKSSVIHIDSIGNIIYENEFRNFDHGTPNLSVSSNGDVLINSKVIPWQSLSTSNQQGWLNKVSLKEDDLLWSTLVPRYNYWPRNYEVVDISSQNNGSTFIAGTTVDIDSISSGFFPFYAKLTDEGEIEWLRVVKIKNEASVSNEDYYLKNGQPIKILVKEDGSLFSLGWILVPDENDDLRFKTWMLSLDVNGCLEGEECDHVYVVDTNEEVDKIRLLNQGDTWVYDYYLDTIRNGNLERVHDFVKYEIGEFEMWQNELCNKITNNQGLPDLYMYQDFEKIYFWNTSTGKFDLTYDFDAVYSYSISFHEVCSDLDFENLNLELDGAQEDIYIHPNQLDFNFIQKGVIDDQSIFEEINILEMVGKLEEGLTFQNTEEDCHSSEIGKLRCYSKGSDDFNLTQNQFDHSFECDSIWVEILSSNIEVLETKIDITPNPASEILNFSHQASQVLIYSTNGILVLKDEYVNEVSISHLPSGLYIISVDSELKKHVFFD